MATGEIYSFIEKFLSLWKSGLDASLNLGVCPREGFWTPHPPSKVCKTQKCAKLKVCKTQMCAKPTCIAHALYSYARKPVESESI